MNKISIIVSTNRTLYWKRFCDHVAANPKANIEVIFVGPLDQSGIELPLPVRFITTDVPPALCWAIGAQASTGNYLCFAPDDIVFTPGFFDAADTILSGGIGEFDMITAIFYQNNVNQFGGMRMMSDQNMPLTPVCGVLSKASYNKLGGIDRRFHAVLWDADLYARFVEAGGKTMLLDGFSCHEISPCNQMFVINYDRDFAMIKQLWYRGNKPQLNRNDSIQPYSEAELQC